MIIKSFEIDKKKFNDQDFFLIYGENEGHKKEIIQSIKKKLKRDIESYDETQILNNDELFYEKVFNQSLFEKEKMFIINRCTEKIYELIESILRKTL